MTEETFKKIEGILTFISQPTKDSDNPKAPLFIKLELDGKSKYRTKADWDPEKVKKITEGLETGDKVRLLLESVEYQGKTYWNVSASEVLEKQVQKIEKQETVVESVKRTEEEQVNDSAHLVELCLIRAKSMRDFLKEKDEFFSEISISDIADQIRRTVLASKIKK